MTQRQQARLLRFLVAAIVALASFGPRATYAHSHPVSDLDHHDHLGYDAPAHDDHDDDHGPNLSDSVAHVHGLCLGFAITLPISDGAAVSQNLSPPVCPALSGYIGKGAFRLLKKRVPWPDSLAPPEPFLLGILSRLSTSHPLFGAGTSYALAGCTLVLRC